MSKVVKVALPIIGGIVGGFFGMPQVGYAIGGYLGGRSYGGGNTGGLYGAAGALAGNAAGSYMSGLGSGATTFSPEFSQAGYQGFASMGASTGAGAAGGFSPELSQSAYQGDSGAGMGGMGGAGGDAMNFSPELTQSTYQQTPGLTPSGDYAPNGVGYGAESGGGGGMSPLQQLMQKLGMGPGGSPASPSGGPGIFGTGLSGRNLLSIGSGLYALQQAEALKKASDPFGQYRGAYGEELAALERNPASITTRPGYQAGLQAVQRAGAAQGYNGSGNMAASLAKYGGDFYQQEANRLAYLAGGSQVPGAGQAAGATLAGQGLASIGYGFAPQNDPRRDPNQGSLRYGQ